MTYGWTNPRKEIHGRIFKKRAFVDGTSIKMKYKSAFRSQDYWCRKGYYGMSVQVTCDDNGLLNDINIGIPTGHHDSWVFQRSSLFRKLLSNRFFPKVHHFVLDHQHNRQQLVPILPYVVGDSAYPVSPFLMRPYAERQTNPLGPEERHFTQQLSSARAVVEKAIRRLKGRWRCLEGLRHYHLPIQSKTVLSCAVLHNILEAQREHYEASWINPRARRPEGNVRIGNQCDHQLHCL